MISTPPRPPLTLARRSSELRGEKWDFQALQVTRPRPTVRCRTCVLCIPPSRLLASRQLSPGADFRPFVMGKHAEHLGDSREQPEPLTPRGSFWGLPTSVIDQALIMSWRHQDRKGTGSPPWGLLRKKAESGGHHVPAEEQAPRSHSLPVWSVLLMTPAVS